MSISKEIFGIEKQEEYYPILSGSILNPKNSNYIEGFNDALKEIDEFELSEEELSKRITNFLYSIPCPPVDNLATWQIIIDKTSSDLSKYIKSNQSKLFVRKNK